jgi:hypothetical protein
MRQVTLRAHPVEEITDAIIAVDDTAVPRLIEAMHDDLHGLQSRDARRILREHRPCNRA